MKAYLHLRFVFEKVFVTANFTMDLNTATFEEMQSGWDLSWQSPGDFRWASQSQQTLDFARFAGNVNSSRCGISLG